MTKSLRIDSEKHLARVRKICNAYPETIEKISHGEPTFFTRKKVFVMFANNHHGDGRVAVWIPAAEGVQDMLIEAEPKKFFRPPYVGIRGWIGVELANVRDKELATLIDDAWRLVAPKTLLKVHDSDQ